MSRDNFSTVVKHALAMRAGYRCSYPECEAITIGPSNETDTAISNTGEAAHINSASAGPGARRHDPSLTPEQRKSIENGIWCCNNHAELIDRDETTYTVDLLKSWRTLAELKAKLRQATGVADLSLRPELIKLGIFPESVRLDVLGDENLRIGKAVKFACIKEIWGGKLAGSLRDFLIEYSRNAITHGGAAFVEISFNQKCIELKDDGGLFEINRLNDVSSTRGGGKAYRALKGAFRLSTISVERTPEGLNRTYIPFVSEPIELPAVNPCAIVLNRGGRRPLSHDNFQFLAACDRLYVVAPDFTCYSDALIYVNMLSQIVQTNPNVTLVVQEATDDVIAHLREEIVGVEIIGW